MKYQVKFSTDRVMHESIRRVAADFGKSKVRIIEQCLMASPYFAAIYRQVQAEMGENSAGQPPGDSV